jgi:hypothetical protein
MDLKCGKCGCNAGIAMKPLDDNAVYTLALTHAEYEQLAWHCSKCDKVFCGKCVFPGWQAMKAAAGLSGPALAAKLEADPDALFEERACCPFCRSRLEPKVEAQATSMCFIATAACGTDRAHDVVRLREFREEVLRPTLAGRELIAVYETLSPPIARLIARSDFTRYLARQLIVRPARKLADAWLARISSKHQLNGTRRSRTASNLQ